MRWIFFSTPLFAAFCCLCSISCVTIQEPQIQKYTETVYISENRSVQYSEVVPVTRAVTTEEELIPYISWSNPLLRFGGQKYVWYYGYDLSRFPYNSRMNLKLMLHEQKYFESSVVRALDMSPRGQILRPPQISASDDANPPQVTWTWITMDGDTSSMTNWINLANIKLNYARFIGGQANLWTPDVIGRTLELDTRGARDIAVVISGPTIPQNARFTARLEYTQVYTDNQTSSGERQEPYQLETKVEKERTVFRSRQAPFWEILFRR